MRFWRDIGADRSSGGVLALLVALSIAFQTLLTGGAAGAAPTPSHVLCTATGPEAVPSGPAGNKHDCPCSELCRAGILVPAVLTPADATGLPIRFADRIEIAVDHGRERRPGLRPRAYHATGPPVQAS